MKWIILILVFLILFLLSSKLEFRVYKKEAGKGEISLVLVFLFWYIKLKTIDFGSYLKKTMEMYTMKENIKMTLKIIDYSKNI